MLLSFPFLLELRFGSQGASRARVERLLALESCRCHRKSCYQKLASSKATLLQYLQQLWSLPKHIQDEYIKQVAGNRKGKEWFLLGKRMASKCVVAMIGFGNARMARIGKSQVDRRYKVWGLATLRQNSIHVIGISCVFIFVCLSMFVFLLACLLVCCFLSVSAKTPSFALVPEAFKKPAVKTRLINQFLLDVYSKAGGMLPDRPFGSTYLNLKLLKASCQEFCTSRFQRGGRPRKMQPEKLTVVMGSVHSEVGEAGVFRLTLFPCCCFLEAVKPAGDASSSEGEDTADLVSPKETLESDMELKMHLLGMNGYFSWPRPEVMNFFFESIGDQIQPRACETNFASAISSLPTRWLAPGTLRMLYHQMGQTDSISLLSSNGNGSKLYLLLWSFLKAGFTPRYNHFHRVYRRYWGNVLKFLAVSQHGACDVCVDLKDSFKLCRVTSLQPLTCFNMCPEVSTVSTFLCS